MVAITTYQCVPSPWASSPSISRSSLFFLLCLNLLLASPPLLSSLFSPSHSLQSRHPTPVPSALTPEPTVVPCCPSCNTTSSNQLYLMSLPTAECPPMSSSPLYRPLTLSWPSPLHLHCPPRLESSSQQIGSYPPFKTQLNSISESTNMLPHSCSGRVLSLGEPTLKMQP